MDLKISYFSWRKGFVFAPNSQGGGVFHLGYENGCTFWFGVGVLGESAAFRVGKTVHWDSNFNSLFTRIEAFIGTNAGNSSNLASHTNLLPSCVLMSNWLGPVFPTVIYDTLLVVALVAPLGCVVKRLVRMKYWNKKNCIKHGTCRYVVSIGNSTQLYGNWIQFVGKQNKLERLRSEKPLPSYDYPYWWFISDPKSKHDKVNVTNFKKMSKIEFCKKLYMRHIFRSCLIRCMNMKWIQPDL